MSVLEALRSWRYAKAQPTAGVRRAQSRSSVWPVLTTGACMAAMLLLLVPLYVASSPPLHSAQYRWVESVLCVCTLIVE